MLHMFLQTLSRVTLASVICLLYTNSSNADFSEFTTDQATVAVHVSENTKRNWQKLSSQPDNFGLSHSNSRGWKYWHIHGFLMEQLRSDGTPFKVVSDNEIKSGVLRDEMGLPKYATLFSLNNPCISDETSTEIDAFVIAGGGVISGGASWTRDQDCEPRDTHITSSVSENHFSNSYQVINTLDSNNNTLWINSINDTLPTWLQYRLEGTNGGYPNISKVELVHSRYGDNSTFRYLIDQYEVQVSNSSTCASSTFVTVATNSGNNVIGEVQETSFNPVPARCVRINILSSHETLPYANHDTSQWVGLAELRVFNSEGLEVTQIPRISATATSENQFSSSYQASNSIDNNPNNLWINQIDASLPVSVDYRLAEPQGDLVSISSIAIQHSNYEERQTGFKYLVKDYDLLYSTDSNCANLTLIDSLRGNNFNREIQKTKLETPVGVRCIRVRINSSYESEPYLNEDTTQWVAIAGFQVFDQSGNALINSTDISNNPWKPMGLRPLNTNGCFDLMRLETAGIANPLTSHFEQDSRVRGYKLATNQNTFGVNRDATTYYHWGMETQTLNATQTDRLASVLVSDVNDSSSVCGQDSDKPIFVEKVRGNGKYLYSASTNSLAGWSMYSSAGYVYGVYRNFVDQMHRSNNMASVRLGSWQWPYVAGFMTRHDHYPHFGFDGNPNTVFDNTLVAQIEQYSDGILGGTTLRDFPVSGGYYILDRVENDLQNTIPESLPSGNFPCASPAGNLCDFRTKTDLDTLAILGAEIGNHSQTPSGFLNEITKIDRYLGTTAIPRIYASHGAYAHFDNNGRGLVGVQTLADSGVQSKGEDAFGAHPHFALRLSSTLVEDYGDDARWDIIEIPATAYAVVPGSARIFSQTGVISHEISADPDFCNNDSTPSRSCMEKAVDLTYNLGGIINLYDHIGDSEFLTGIENPTASQFDRYINYTQDKDFVETTSPRKISSWWRARDIVRVEQRDISNSSINGIEVDVSTKVGAVFTGDNVSVNIELPVDNATHVSVRNNNSVLLAECPAVLNGLKNWLSDPQVVTGCYIRDNSRVRVKAQPNQTFTITW